MNKFSHLDAQQGESRLAQVASHEARGVFEDSRSDFHEIQSEIERDRQEALFLAEAAEIREADMARGWPGDGSGEDDLADYNAAEADDYLNG